MDKQISTRGGRRRHMSINHGSTDNTLLSNIILLLLHTSYFDAFKMSTTTPIHTIPCTTSSLKHSISCLSINSKVLINNGSTKYKRCTKLQAGLTEIEPDLNEDPRDRWATNGIEPEDYVYGVYDDHHTYFEGEEEKGTFWGAVAQEYNSMDPPTGFQGFISWIFLPAVAAGMYFHVPGEYLYIGAALFAAVFCVIEMDKPDQPHNFEPQIYNMERGARDKLISDYNTMDIWDFNEKYGDLWDFTVKHDNIEKR